MTKYESVYPALEWRYKKFSHYSVLVEDLTRSLSVEELPYRSIPDNLWVNVRAFRKLRMEDRHRMTLRFLQETRDIKVTKLRSDRLSGKAKIIEQIDEATSKKFTSKIFPEFDLPRLREEVERVLTRALTDIDTDPLDLVARGNFQLALASLDQARVHLDLAILTQAKAVAKLQRGR